ncbi:hypothetical protein ABK040_005808 [Willaertia magna]
MLATRYALYFILLLAVLVSLSFLLYIKHYSFKIHQSTVIVTTSDGRMFHPPSSFNPVMNEHLETSAPNIHNSKHVVIEEKNKSEEEKKESTEFNVQKIEMKKHETQIVNGIFDDLIQNRDEKKENIKSKLLRDSVLSKSLDDKNTNVKCRNTVQGPNFITDSRGYICSILHVDPKTQCCRLDIDLVKAKSEGLPPVERYSCKTCNDQMKCCNSYEFCVSCCMDIDKREELIEIYNERKNEKLFKGVKTVFEFCSTRCRTTSKSVQNENRFKDSNYKYCFGKIN